MPDRPPLQPDDRVALPRSAWALGAWALVALIAALSLGRGGSLIDTLVLVLPQIPLWAAPGLAYVAAGMGYGILATALFRHTGDATALGVAIGIALVSLISQVAGSLGLLKSPIGAAGVLIPGWVALGVFLWRRRSQRLTIKAPSLVAWLGVPSVAILIAAASAPPGWLWDSEFAGFDALSYHLQLPQEWLAIGRIEPLTHNVYSFLPSSFEAGVYHLAALTGAPIGEVTAAPSRFGSSIASARSFGLLGGEGWRLISAQYLHALLTLFSAWLVARTARAVVGQTDADGVPARRAGAVAGTLVLATPWCVVVGSLAYNEMPVVGLGAAALLTAMDQRLNAWSRGLLAGLLVGAACGFKPTAMTFLTPGVGIALLAFSTPRQWPGLIAAGTLAGIATLMPWTLRNWAACGNPVFPFASDFFGTGHWTPEQVARYARGHAFDGTILDRAWLLIAQDPHAAPGARDVARWRGMMNPQFGMLFPAAIGALTAILTLPRFASRARRSGIVLGVMLLLQTLAWLLTTHLQSRFLVPMVIPAAILIAMATSGITRSVPRAGVVAWVGTMLMIVQTGYLITTFLSQRRGGPNEFTPVGPGAFTGQFEADPLTSPASTINRSLPTDARVYLLGDAAPLYFTARGPGRLLWHTTWDRSPLGDAVRRSQPAGVPPDSTDATVWTFDPADWTRVLRGLGVTHVLLNLTELNRYGRSGWYDPEVTPERVAVWIATLGPPIAAWNLTGQALFELPPPNEQAAPTLEAGEAQHQGDPL